MIGAVKRFPPFAMPELVCDLALRDGRVGVAVSKAARLLCDPLELRRES